MEITPNAPLKELNTFGLDATAEFCAIARSNDDLKHALAWARAHGHIVTLLGGGSNVILHQQVPGLVIVMRQQERRMLIETSGNGGVMVKAAAGEPWHDFVNWTLAQGLGGLENLSLIPGTVGAAPVQNIGAYGISLSDVCVGVEALNINTGNMHSLAAQDCEFDYRDSLFKQQRGAWAVLGVTFRLSRTAIPNVAYGSLRAALQAIPNPSCQDVARAVCAVRSAKLPDPAVIGNVGSFFKNPQVTSAAAAVLAQRHPDIPLYPQPDGSMKIAAGWLIEQSGWKGKSLGPAGCYEKQALVLVNHGGATAEDILRLADTVQADVHQHFGVTLEMEPTIY